MKIDLQTISKEAYKTLVIESLPHILRGSQEEVADKSKVIHKIMDIFSSEIYELYNNADKIGKLMSIDYVSGKQLDNYGQNFNILRRFNEQDEEYKIRIITTLSIKFTNSSIESLYELVKAITNKEFTDFSIIERPVETNYGSFAFSPKNFNQDEIERSLEGLELVRGAGIELLIIISQALTWQDMYNNNWGFYKNNNFLW